MAVAKDVGGRRWSPVSIRAGSAMLIGHNKPNKRDGDRLGACT